MLEAELELLFKVSKDLEARLSSVLRPPMDPLTGADCQKEEPWVDIAARLRVYASNVRSVRTALSDIIGRCEL